MRYIINVALILIILGLTYLLVNGIKEPIEFQAEKERREDIVIAQLDKIRVAQESYREITGELANTFDTLKQVLRTEDFKIVSIIGDRDKDDEIRYDTTFVSARDSIVNLGINLDSLEYIPFTNGEVFDIKSDTMTYQATLVHVCEVGTNRNKYMGKYADEKYTRYDDTYDPNFYIKFGDMYKPSLAGNW